MSAERRVHIVGAGMAGLSAALHLSLAGENVTLYEAAPFAGGRCRSFFDRDLNCRIDNGSHLVLSGNAAIQDYLYLSNAIDTMGGPGQPVFPFMDLASSERWTVRMNKGLIPWWILDPSRRIPGTRLADYASLFALMYGHDRRPLPALLKAGTPLYRRFWEPMIIGVLNTEPERASGALLANVLSQSFARGGSACVPLIPKIGLSESFVLPCLNVLRQHGVEMHYGQRLRSLATDGACVRELDFNGEIVALSPRDWVILALPAWVAKSLLPEVPMPDEFRSIINAHFRVDGLHDPMGFTGLVGGLAEWVFTRNGVVSVTISCAERYGDYPVRDMAYYVWKDIAKLYRLDPETVPPHRIFKEKYATFAATPQQNRRRPRAWIGWKNLALAGEWTDTGLPSTIEGAIRSGVKAAQVAMRWNDT